MEKYNPYRWCHCQQCCYARKAWHKTEVHRRYRRKSKQLLRQGIDLTGFRVDALLAA